MGQVEQDISRMLDEMDAEDALNEWIEESLAPVIGAIQTDNESEFLKQVEKFKRHVVETRWRPDLT